MAKSIFNNQIGLLLLLNKPRLKVLIYPGKSQSWHEQGELSVGDREIPRNGVVLLPLVSNAISSE